MLYSAESRPVNLDALLAQARQGQRGAFDALMLEYVPALTHLVKSKLDEHTRTVMEVDDALQEIQIKVFRAVGTFEFRGLAAFRCWLMTVAENALRDLQRRHFCHKRFAKKVRSLQDRAGVSPSGHEEHLADQLRSSGVGPASAVVGDEQSMRVRRAIQQLPAQVREIIELVQFRRQPVAEVARLLGKTECAVRKQFSRAIAALAGVLSGRDGQEEKGGPS